MWFIYLLLDYSLFVVGCADKHTYSSFRNCSILCFAFFRAVTTVDVNSYGLSLVLYMLEGQCISGKACQDPNSSDTEEATC